MSAESNKDQRRKTRSPTLVDVAAAAAVSVSTAARVLRESDYPVDPALKERVRGAAGRLGYVPNVLARNLRAGAPTMIGLVVGDMLDPYYGEIAEAVTRHAESRHSMVAIVCNMQRDPLLELKYCQQLWEHRVAGLILAGGGFDQWSHLDRLSSLVRQMMKAGVQVVTLSPRGIGTPTFCVDNERVFAAMADHLVRRGHRRVGVLLGPAQSEATQQRLRGAAGTLTRSGAGFHVLHAHYTEEAGAESAAALMERDANLTAFIVGSKSMAIGVIHRLEQSGRSVPGDVSIVGVGSPRTSQWLTPRLATVDVSLAACGRAALDHIAAGVRGDALPAIPEFPFRLFEGASVADRTGRE